MFSSSHAVEALRLQFSSTLNLAMTTLVRMRATPGWPFQGTRQHLRLLPPGTSLFHRTWLSGRALWPILVRPTEERQFQKLMALWLSGTSRQSTQPWPIRMALNSWAQMSCIQGLVNQANACPIKRAQRSDSRFGWVPL